MTFLPAFFFSTILAVTIQPTFAATEKNIAWSLNDVSILLPLPPSSDISRLLKTTDHGPRGELLPRKTFDLFPDLVRFVDREQIFKQDLKVISIRLDPCFIEGAGPFKCRKQIRLVWQPVQMAGAASTTLDAAVHTFYEFDDAAWSALLVDWIKLRGLTSSSLAKDSLDIHPVLRAEGYQGSYWNQLRETIMNHCGETNLVRASAMLLNGPLMWIFLGFDIDANGDGQPIQVAKLAPGRRAQSFVMDFESLSNLEEFQARVAPAPIGEKDWVSFALDSKGFKIDRTESDVKSIVDLAFQFENPLRSNPGTLDCVSCHMAQTARLWGEKNGPAWNWPGDFATSRFTNTRDLKNNSVNPLQVNRLRGFGYFEDDPLISQRVINETAIVADILDKENPL